MLTCPHCSIGMGAVRYGRARAWRCGDCGGHAANFSVLRSALPEPRWDRMRRAAVKATARSDAPGCPSCRKPMLRVPGPKHDLDACRRCQLFWFDPRELLAPTGADEPELSRPARAAVAKRKARRRTDALAPGPDNMWELLCGVLGLPFEADEKPLRWGAWATLSLTAAVLALGIASIYFPTEAIARFAYYPNDPWRADGITLLSYFFVHAGWLHLLSNAYFLAVFGDNVEEALSRSGFFALVALGTVGGALAHGWFDPRPFIPVVGASAGISALLVYYALRFPQARIGWAWRLFFVPVWWIRTPAYVAFLLWLLCQGLLAHLQASGMTNISAFGHLGGVAAGVLFWFAQRTMNE